MTKRILGLLMLALFTGYLPSAQAVTLVYTDLATFLGVVNPGYYLEDFEGLPTGILTQTEYFSSGPYAYNAFAQSNLWGWPYPNSTFTEVNQTLSLNDSTDPLILTFTSGNVTAVGAFIGGDGYSDPPGPFRIEINDGTFAEVDAIGAAAFVGFATTDGSPITSMVITADNSSAPPYNWVTVNDLIVGSSAIGDVEPIYESVFIKGTVSVRDTPELRLRLTAKVRLKDLEAKFMEGQGTTLVLPVDHRQKQVSWLSLAGLVTGNIVAASGTVFDAADPTLIGTPVTITADQQTGLITIHIGVLVLEGFGEVRFEELPTP